MNCGVNNYEEVLAFIKENQRNLSRYDDNEGGLYCNWIKHNKKLLNSGELKLERVGFFKRLLSLCEKY